jgi:excisionase family DNA binding protein
MNKGRLLTVEEVAERLGVNQDTVRRWIRNKELEAIDLGGRAGYRISEAALDRFIDERRSTAHDGS